MSAVLADAIPWLASKPSGCAQFVVFDPPYTINQSTVRGREDGAAGSVFAPFAFMHRAMVEIARVLVPGGVCEMFADWKRQPDVLYLATMAGLRPAVCIAWTRTRPGTGGLFRSAWDPIQIVSRGIPRAVDRSAVCNVIEANYDTKRTHPYAKPAEVFRVPMSRSCVPGDLVLDPFAGSGVSEPVALSLGLRWEGCDIDPAYAEAA